ncbi:MAG: tetratricopeptide repeat protein [Phycisphaerales bacterium]
MADRTKALMQMLEDDPRDTFCLYSLGQEAAKAEHFEEALKWYHRVLDIDPQYCYAWFHMARALEALDRNDEACTTLETGMKHAQQAGDTHAVQEMQVLLDTYRAESSQS